MDVFLGGGGGRGREGRKGDEGRVSLNSHFISFHLIPFFHLRFIYLFICFILEKKRNGGLGLKSA